MPVVSTSSDSFRKSGIFGTFGTQDCKWLDILEELGDVEKAIEHDVNVTNLGSLRGNSVLTLSSLLAIGFC